MDSVILIDLDGTIAFANERACQLLGREGLELVGKSLEDILPITIEQLNSRDRSAPMNGQLEMVRPDGSSLYLRFGVGDVETRDGSKQLVLFLRDLEECIECDVRLNVVLETAVDAIITIDASGIILSANPSTVRLFGYPVNELIGNNVSMLMPEPYSSQHDTYLANYHRTQKPQIIGVGREIVARRKDGSVFPVHLAVSELQLGERKMFTGVVRDISDIKRAQKELADINAELEARVELQTGQLQDVQKQLIRNEKFSTLGKVAGGIAHEIRNPLNAVKTSAYYLLNAQSPSESKVREHLERIDRQVSLIDNVITALSDVAKMPEANRQRTQLIPLIERQLKMIDIPKNILIEFAFDPETPPVLVDENQISIAIKNLIRNARDAMPEGGVLKIGSENSDDSIRFFVEDNGSGIAPDQLQKILEPLFTTKARGMGLGLSITITILEKNKGKLFVESEIGKGSRFTFQLAKA
ncbi:MAG: PAS domain S-box protein [Pirellulaceae bacterium]